MYKLKHELLCLASEEPNFDTKQSDHFLDSAKSLIKQCSEVQIHFECLSQRIKSAITQYQQKVQAIMGNFEQKLQVYLSCEDQSLALKDQESFINANQVVIEQIRQSVKECQSQILQFSNIISPKTNPKKEKVSKLLVCKQQIVQQQKNSGIVSMVFRDLQSVQFNQFTEPYIICSGSFLSVSQQDIDISLIFRFEQNSKILKLFREVSFQVKQFTSRNDQHLILNDLVFMISKNEMNLIGRVPCNRFDLIRSAIAHNDNIIFSSSRYQKIYVWDFNLANQAKGYQMRPGISMTDGIKDLQAIKGMSDTFVYIYNGILFKHALIKDDQRNYSDIIHQGNKNMATLKILPDNIHLAAISSKQEFFIIDHFTSQVVKIGIIKHSFQSTLSFYLHPRFDLYKYPIVLLSDKHTTQIFDCVESGLQITEALYPMGIFEAFDTKHIISKRNWQFYIQQVE